VEDAARLRRRAKASKRPKSLPAATEEHMDRSGEKNTVPHRAVVAGFLEGTSLLQET
jgi:hypothetical protein